MSPRTLRLENQLERTFTYGDRKLAIFSRQVKFAIPFTNAEITWSRPSAVWIRHADGSEHVVRINDPTRNAVLLILGGAVTGTALFALVQLLSSKASA